MKKASDSSAGLHLFSIHVARRGKFFLLAVCLLSIAGCGKSSEPTGDEAAIAARIAPVGKVNVGEPQNASEADSTAQTVAETAEGETQGAAAAGDESPEPAQTAQQAEGASAGKGQSIYESACLMCHGTGAAGAPKVGDKAAWTPRIAQGMDTLVKNAISGFQGSTGMMPPKGGHSELSDEDIRAAVTHMVGASQ
jgi:cytochrome c